MISAGHRWADIAGYTLPQLEAFCAAIAAQDRAAMRTALIVARGAKGTKQSFETMLRGLK